MKNIFMIIFMAVFAITAFTQGTSVKSFQCPMKCEGEKTYDKPGTCPVCGMKLMEVTSKPLLVNTSLHIVGAMKNVMMKGELQGTINLDTIATKKHLYGFGPEEYQLGEITILDGKSYQSRVISTKKMKVAETYKMKASFFAYQNIEAWNEVSIPDSVIGMEQLEHFLDQTTKEIRRPYFFRLLAICDSAVIHVVNLPKGTKIKSPEDAHIGQVNFHSENEPVEMLGFFSTEHKAVFTHHDTFIHVHLITADKSKMGHLESLVIRKGTARLYLPVDN